MKEAKTNRIIIQRKCQLCGKTDSSVNIWVGGYFAKAHQKCAEIGHKAVELYLLNLHHSMFGIEQFAEDLLKVIEKEKKLLEASQK